MWSPVLAVAIALRGQFRPKVPPPQLQQPLGSGNTTSSHQKVVTAPPRSLALAPQHPCCPLIPLDTRPSMRPFQRNHPCRIPFPTAMPILYNRGRFIDKTALPWLEVESWAPLCCVQTCPRQTTTECPHDSPFPLPAGLHVALNPGPRTADSCPHPGRAPCSPPAEGRRSLGTRVEREQSSGRPGPADLRQPAYESALTSSSAWLRDPTPSRPPRTVLCT